MVTLAIDVSVTPDTKNVCPNVIWKFVRHAGSGAFGTVSKTGEIIMNNGRFDVGIEFTLTTPMITWPSGYGEYTGRHALSFALTPQPDPAESLELFADSKKQQPLVYTQATQFGRPEFRGTSYQGLRTHNNNRDSGESFYTLSVAFTLSNGKTIVLCTDPRIKNGGEGWFWYILNALGLT